MFEGGAVSPSSTVTGVTAVRTAIRKDLLEIPFGSS